MGTKLIAKQDHSHGHLTGRIIDADDRPIRGARVFAWIWDIVADQPERQTIECCADDDGRFRLGPLPAGPGQTIWCEARGFARLRVGGEQLTDIVVYPDLAQDLGSIMLVPGAQISGCVVDAEGNGIPDANIEITLWSHQLAHTIDHNGPALHASTDAEGRISGAILPPGTFGLAIEAGSRPRKHEGGLVTSGMREYDFGTVQMTDDHVVLRGRIIDEDDEPIGEVQVRTLTDRNHHVLTNDDGRFELVARDEQPRMIEFEKPGYCDLTQEIEDSAHIEATLSRASYLEGIVVDSRTGAPLSLLDVQASELVPHGPDGQIAYVG